MEVQPLPEFSRGTVTLGDHLRLRRLELSLYQKEIVAKLGVTASTI